MPSIDFWKAYYCPHCGSDFEPVKGSLVCKQNHCFDISQDGYVNLIPVNKKHSLHPGDSKDMVMARNELLSSGIYDFLVRWIVDYVNETGLVVSNFLEVGCGTGYYLGEISKGIQAEGIYGTDISKEAIKFCAKTQKQHFFSIQNSFDLSLKNGLFDLVLSIFSPFDNGEVERVLSENGEFILVRPHKDHLRELYEIIGLTSKDKSEVVFENLYLVKEDTLTITLHPDSHLISLLIQMTPLFWSVDREHFDIQNIVCKELTAKLKVSCYRKK